MLSHSLAHTCSVFTGAINNAGAHRAPECKVRALGSNFIATFWCCANIKFYWSLKQSHAFMTIIFLYLYKEGGQLKTSSTYPSTSRCVYYGAVKKRHKDVRRNAPHFFSSRLPSFLCEHAILQLGNNYSRCPNGIVEYFSDASLRGNYFFMHLLIIDAWNAFTKFSLVFWRKFG